MKKIFLFLLSFATFHFAIAQNGDLMIRKGDKGLYLDYKVAPKESFYSIGRLFNIHPAHIASFNSLNMKKGLTIGQMLRIPLTDTNFSQKTAKGRPVFYKVGNNEGLYRVTQNNGKVLMADLRKWNHLTSDKIQTGDKLIVGYLVSGEA
ncbi:MAG: LysM peptidoglycan-binding domain-containing protein, partial [Bacteroidetes bacterium]|nr:LysM peptidoglycan-binding domain-containing protein [Bacteroidota bacterium]